MKEKKRKRKSTGRGSVFLIAVLLFGSATVRIGMSATEVLAKSQDVEAPKAAMDASEKAAESEERLPTGRLLEALMKRESRVKKLENEIEIRAKALEVSRHEIERRIEVLVAAEDKLRATLSRAAIAADDDVANLTTVYENMKPKNAAALFEAMEPSFAAGFLAKMRTDAAAGVMANLKPETAYTISVLMAGRNAGAPKK